MVTLVARQGRQLQRYSKKSGCRLVVGCIPYKFKSDDSGSACGMDQLEVLVISSRKGNAIMFPKGGWESDEKIKEAAAREALEEAGVVGNIEAKLGKYRYASRSSDAIHEGVMFALNVTKQLDEWPEMGTRKRVWVSIAKAKEGCPHLWMVKALETLEMRLSNLIIENE